MINYIVRLIITNNVNYDEDIQFAFFATSKDVDEWKDSKYKEQEKWNHNTPGAVSHRYYDFDTYDVEKILNFDMSYFTGMKLRDFLTLLKTIELRALIDKEAKQ